MSAILSFIGWTFLPSLITNWTLTILYRLFTRAGDPIPQRGTPRYDRDHRRLHILIITLYLLYTIYESYHLLLTTPTLYDLLSVPYDVDERSLRSRFRRLSVQYHPDKAGADSGDYFVVLKSAYDVLSDPVKRWAYDRFGGEMVDWKGVSTQRDYLSRGVMGMAPWYLGSGLVLVVLTVLGKFNFGRYWRYYCLFSLVAFEAAVVTRSHNLLDPLFSWKWLSKPLLPFEQLTLARKVALTSLIAISQLGPLLQERQRNASESREVLEAKLERIQNIVGFVEAEAAKVLMQEYLPFDGDQGGLRTLERRLGEWMVEQRVRNEPVVRDAMGRALARRRNDAPVGARGTK